MAVPTGTDVLLLVHPQDLPEATLYAIDQFVLKGGKALVFVDPYSEAQAALPGAAAKPVASSLDRLFSAWGFKFLPGIVAGDRRAARRAAVPVEGRGAQTVDYVAWLGLPSDNLSRDDPITADLSQIAMATAGILQPFEGAATHFEPLISDLGRGRANPGRQGQGHPRCRRAAGPFPPRRTALRARRARHRQGRDRFSRRAAQGHAAGRCADRVDAADQCRRRRRYRHARRPLLGANSRFLRPSGRRAARRQRRFSGQCRRGAGRRQDLIGLRSRGTVARPFEVVERIQRSADDRYAVQQRTLAEKVKQAEAKLREVSDGDRRCQAGAATADQNKEIDAIRADLIESRRQLRQVQAALRADIGHLKLMLEFFDIALVPIVVAAAALVMAALRLRRWRHRPPAAA